MQSLLFLLLSQFRGLFARQRKFPEEQRLLRIGQRCFCSFTNNTFHTVGQIVLNIKLFVQSYHSYI